MLKHIIFIAFLVVFALKSVAQHMPDESLDEPELQTQLVLKFAPLSLLDFYSALQMALEYRVGKVSSIQVEAGYILPLLPKDTGYTWLSIEGRIPVLF